MIVEALMESPWRGDPERDEALHEAIHATLGLWGFCEVLADQCSTETDERMATTTRVVRHCAKVCETAIVELANWEMIVPGALGPPLRPASEPAKRPTPTSSGTVRSCTLDQVHIAMSCTTPYTACGGPCLLSPIAG